MSGPDALHLVPHCRVPDTPLRQNNWISIECKLSIIKYLMQSVAKITFIGNPPWMGDIVLYPDIRGS